MLSWFVLSLAWSSITAYMLVTSPERLKGDLTYKVSTFGLVDYLNTKKIEVHLWNTLDGCDPPTDDILMLNADSIGFLMKKGDCSFRRQAVNARRAGAYLVLTYEDSGVDGKLTTPSSEEETRDLELPPVVMISRKNGEAIRDALTKGEKVSMVVDWDINLYKPPVDVEYLYSVVDYKSISIYHKLLTFQLESLMTPVNASSSDVPDLMNLVNIPKFYRRKDFNLSIDDSHKFCVNNEDICVNPHPSVKLSMPIDEVVVAGFLFCLQVELDKGNKTQNLQLFAKILGDYEELLRLNEGKDQIVNLTKHFEQSLNPEELKKLTEGKQAYLIAVSDCLRSKFGDIYGDINPKNNVLQRLVDVGSKKKFKVPSLFISGHLVRGDITPMTALSAICDVIPLDVRPTQCANVESFLQTLTFQLEEREGPGGNLSLGRRLFYTFLCTALIFGLTYLLGNYLLEKRLQRDIAADIDQSLERYYQIQNTSIEIVSKDQELKADHS